MSQAMKFLVRVKNHRRRSNNKGKVANISGKGLPSSHLRGPPKESSGRGWEKKKNEQPPDSRFNEGGGVAKKGLFGGPDSKLSRNSILLSLGKGGFHGGIL